MKAFVAVLAVLLLLFGASIIYFRGDFNLGKNLSPKVSESKDQKTGPGAKTETAPSAPVAANPTPEATKYTTLEIRQNKLGAIKIGEERIYTAVARDDTGAAITVDAGWSLTSPNLGSLSLAQGPETKFTAKAPGKGKILASFKEIKAEKDIEVGSGAVAGATVKNSTTATTNSTTIYAVGTSSQSTEVKPYAIRLYDPSGNRFNVGETRTFTSQVQYTDNSVKTPDLTWSVDPSDLGSLDKTKGSSVTFRANRGGSGTLKAVLDNLSASLYIQIN